MPDPAGTIYVADEGPVGLFGQLLGPYSVEVFAPGTNSDVAPIRTIKGASTGLSTPTDIKVDSAGDVYVADGGNSSITEYAPGASGNAAPICTIKGTNTGLDQNDDMSLEPDGTLIVGNDAPGAPAINVYAPGACGNVKPIRTIAGTKTGFSSNSTRTLDGVGADAAGTIFAANTYTSSILIFAPGANGNVAPESTISGTATGLSRPNGIIVGFDGTLNVTNGGHATTPPTPSIEVFAPGSTGDAAPSRVIAGSSTGLVGPDDLSVDVSGTIYATDGGHTPSSVLIYAAGATGDVAPTGVIGGTTSTVNAPEGVAVAGAPPPTLTTTASSSSIALSASTHDTATLSGGTNPTGSLIFELFGPSDATCSAAPAFTSPVSTVTGNGSYPSPSFTPLTAGTYSWVASYSGDTNNAPVSTKCGDPAETVTVITTPPTNIATTLSGGGQSGTSISVPQGTPVTDAATLTGVTTSAGGTVLYDIYSNSACTAFAGSGGSVSVTGGSVPASAPVPLLTPATYYWKASYSGDANNAPLTSTCGPAPTGEVETVTPLPKTTFTVPAVSGDFADPTTVSGVLTITSTSAPLSGEPVTFTLNGQENCSATTDATGMASCSITPARAAGPYQLIGSFLGDTTRGYAGSIGIANFTVTLEQTALSYTGATSATNGQPVSLSGVLTTDDPSAGTALGGKTVTFTLGTGGTAQACMGTTDSTGTASCTIASVSQTGTSVPVGGSFAGDTFYLPASASSTVLLTTGIQPTSLTTSLSGGGQSGTTITVPEKTAVTDTATLSGANASSATGTVTYNVYPDSDCDESPVATSTVTVTAGSVPASTPVTQSKSGTYNWVASYSGDVNNGRSVSKCGSETEIVKGPESTHIETKLLGTGKSDDGILTVSSGTAVSDSATLSGDSASSAGGTVTYTVYSDALCNHGSDSPDSCTPTVVSTDTVTVANGVVPDSSPVTLSPGIYSWQASYSGDALNKPSTSEYGSETEVVSGPNNETMLSTSLSGGGQSGDSISVPVNTAVTDSATLSGPNASTATGTVTYSVYSDGDCTVSAGSGGTVSVTAGSVPASTAVTLSSAGAYSWQASYSGDANNAASTSSCGSETETVASATTAQPTHIKTKLLGSGKWDEDILSVSSGSAVSDSATLSGANVSSAGATVTYTVYSDAACRHNSHSHRHAHDSWCMPTVVSTDTVTVANGVVPNSSPVTLSPGIYSWQASYSGDALNKPSTSELGSETEIVTTASKT